MFPQPGAVPIGSAAVGGDEQPPGVRVFLPPHLLPPFFDGGHREDRGVVVDADGDPGAVVGEVVDPVGDGLAVGQVGEVVGGHLLGCADRLPLLPGLGEASDQLLLLGVHADHRVATVQVLPGQRVDIAELGVAVGVLGALEGLAGALQAVPGRAQDRRHRGVTEGGSHRGQFSGQMPGRLRGPPQRGLGIPAGLRLDERIQILQHFGVGHLGLLPATTSPPHTTRTDVIVTIQLGQTTANGRPRRTRGPMHRGDTTMSP